MKQRGGALAIQHASPFRPTSCRDRAGPHEPPGMTGLEMLPKVKALRPEVPVIMITAYGDPETKRRAIEGGADVPGAFR